MPLQHENTWFERSGQMWKLRTMWMLAGVTLLVALFGFSTQWFEQHCTLAVQN